MPKKRDEATEKRLQDAAQKLRAAGWRYGSAKDFLGLSEEETLRVELRLAAPKLGYRVIWSDIDLEYVGLCDAYPSLSHLDRTPTSALEGVIRVVEDVAFDLLTDKSGNTAETTLKKQADPANEALTFNKGVIDGRRGHPPAELTISYLQGYKRGLEQQEENA